MKTIVALLLLTISAFAEDNIQWNRSGVTASPRIMINPYPDIVIVCATGSVVVSTKTGHVEFRDGCEPDDAAKSFWRAVEKMGIQH